MMMCSSPSVATTCPKAKNSHHNRSSSSRNDGDAQSAKSNRNDGNNNIKINTNNNDGGKYKKSRRRNRRRPATVWKQEQQQLLLLADDANDGDDASAASTAPLSSDESFSSYDGASLMAAATAAAPAPPTTMYTKAKTTTTPSTLHSAKKKKKKRFNKNKSSTSRSTTTTASVDDITCIHRGSSTSNNRSHTTSTFPPPILPPPLTPEEKSRYIALDAEMVEVLGPDDGIRRSRLARIALVDYDGRTVYDAAVRVRETVVDYRTSVSGITEADLASEDAVSFDAAQRRVRELIRGKIVVGHALKNDFRALGLHPPPPWHDVRDTARYEPFLRRVVKVDDANHGGTSSLTPPQSLPLLLPEKLRTLAKHRLGWEIQAEGRPHSPVEDALAALELYKRHRVKWEKAVSYKMERTREIVDAARRHQQEQQQEEQQQNEEC